MALIHHHQTDGDQTLRCFTPQPKSIFRHGKDQIMKLNLNTSAMYLCITSCLLSLSLASAQTPAPLAQTAQKADVHSESKSSKSTTNVYAQTATKAKQQQSYIKVYREAITLVMQVEKLASSKQLMLAARQCQSVIDLVPRIKELSQGLSPSALPKGNPLVAIDQVCATLMSKVLISLSPKACKEYKSLQRAFTYFNAKDQKTWAPRLQKLASCQ